MSIHLPSYLSCLVSSSYPSYTIYAVMQVTFIHSYIHYPTVHSYINIFTHSYIHPFTQSYIHTLILSNIHTFMHTQYIHHIIHTWLHQSPIILFWLYPFSSIFTHYWVKRIACKYLFYLCVKWIACKDPLLPLCQANSLQTIFCYLGVKRIACKPLLLSMCQANSLQTYFVTCVSSE
jgi:hypothetical protein